MTKTIVEQFVADPKNMRLYQQERAIYEVTALLESEMVRLGVSRSDLAKRLGKTKGWVTQLLDGDANKTIRTIADAFAVLGCEFNSSCREIQVSNYTPPAEHAMNQRVDSPDPSMKKRAKVRERVAGGTKNHRG
jgi:transcriptional regulator with XRE-family HTH domain